MNNKFDVNDTIIRKGFIKKINSIKEKKFVNNILHYILLSQIILMILY